MREEPPKPLIDLLERLHLASAEQVRGVAGRVRRLAQDLPLFESVWVDALAQARVLTPFQAAELNAGRGDSLRVGPYVLAQPMASPAFAACYTARELTSGPWVRLAIGTPIGPARISVSTESVLASKGTVPFSLTRKSGQSPPLAPAKSLADLLPALVSASQLLDSESLAPIMAAGAESGRVWAACRHVVGPTVGEWIVHNGRFAPPCVLEIARQMLVGLTDLERQGLTHGDIGAASVVLTRDGGVVLPFPGLRGLLRPEEGYAHADLSPEGYDYLAPERVVRGTPPDTASDVYACGCLWWHLLTGRAPLPGGSSLAKLRAAETARIADVAELAPDTPAPLAAAISSCLQRDPQQRAPSMAQLAQVLGPPTARGAALLAGSVTRPGVSPPRLAVSMRTIRQSNQTPLWLAAIGGCLVAAVALGWSIWQAGLPRFSTAGQAEPQQSTPSEPDAARPPSANVSAREADRPHQGAEPGPGIAALDSAASGRGTSEGGPPDVVPPPQETQKTVAGPLVLPRGKPLDARLLQLRAGLCVRGEPGARGVVVVSGSALTVRPENVRFENVDFVGQPEAQTAQSGSGVSALLDIQASRAEFRACSFQSAAGSQAAAMRWTHPADRGQLELALPSGRLQLSDCVFRHVAAAVACRTVGAVTIEMGNSLHLGLGPLVQLDHCPRPDEPTAIRLSAVTLRGPGPLLEFLGDTPEEQAGNVTLQSDGCAFVLPDQAALLRFAGASAPDRLLQNLQWTGQGSLVSPGSAIAQWIQPGGRSLALDESTVSIAGLVRSEAAFAGEAEEGPAANRLVRWQAPLQSPNAPGIDPRGLAWPPR